MQFNVQFSIRGKVIEEFISLHACAFEYAFRCNKCKWNRCRAVRLEHLHPSTGENISEVNKRECNY